MRYAPAFELRTFDRLSSVLRGGVILSLVESLALTDLLWIQYNGAPVPSIYKSGVRYQSSCWPRVECPWKDIPRLLETGFGDCKDLVAWRLAELRFGNVIALPHLQVRERKQGTVFHVLIKHSDGSLEDPSKLLGMQS